MHISRAMPPCYSKIIPVSRFQSPTTHHVYEGKDNMCTEMWVYILREKPYPPLIGYTDNT